MDDADRVWAVLHRASETGVEGAAVASAAYDRQENERAALLEEVRTLRERMDAVLHAGPSTALAHSILLRAQRAEADNAALVRALTVTRGALGHAQGNVGWGTVARLACGAAYDAAGALIDEPHPGAAILDEVRTLRDQLQQTRRQVAEVAKVLDPEVTPDACGLYAAAQKCMAELATAREQVERLGALAQQAVAEKERARNVALEEAAEMAEHTTREAPREGMAARIRALKSTPARVVSVEALAAVVKSLKANEPCASYPVALKTLDLLLRRVTDGQVPEASNGHGGWLQAFADARGEMLDDSIEKRVVVEAVRKQVQAPDATPDWRGGAAAVANDLRLPIPSPSEQAPKASAPEDLRDTVWDAAIDTAAERAEEWSLGRQRPMGCRTVGEAVRALKHRHAGAPHHRALPKCAEPGCKLWVWTHSPSETVNGMVVTTGPAAPLSVKCWYHHHGKQPPTEPFVTRLPPHEE